MSKTAAGLIGVLKLPITPQFNKSFNFILLRSHTGNFMNTDDTGTGWPCFFRLVFVQFV